MNDLEAAQTIVYLSTARLINTEFGTATAPVDAVPTASEKARNIADCIVRSGIAPEPRRELARAFGYAIDEEIELPEPPKKDVGMFADYPHCVLTITTNDNSHTYGDRPFMINGSGTAERAIRPGGSTGNHLDVAHGFRIYAPVPPQDLAAFLDGLGDKLVKLTNTAALATVKLGSIGVEEAAASYAAAYTEYEATH